MKEKEIKYDPLTGEVVPQGNLPPDPLPLVTTPKTDINNPAALKALALGKLVAVIENSPVGVALVPAIKELVDRIDGKAPQSVQMTVKQDNASKLSDDQLAALLAMLPNPVIIPPMPKKLDIDN